MNEITLADDVDDLEIDLSDETTRQLLAKRMGSAVAPCYWTLEDEDERKVNTSAYDRKDVTDMMERVLKKMSKDTHTRSVQRGILKNQRIFAHHAGYEDFETAFRDLVEEYHENDIEKVAQWVL